MICGHDCCGEIHGTFYSSLGANGVWQANNQDLSNDTPPNKSHDGIETNNGASSSNVNDEPTNYYITGSSGNSDNN